MIALVLGFVIASRADAFTRAAMWDDELVDQSDLIVIAHLKENRFDTEKDQQDPQYDRKVFFTTVVVSRIIKGNGSPGDMRVGLHDPNYPTVLGGPFAIVPPPAGERPDPSAAIGVAAIVGTIFTTTTDDIRHDQIWFLRSRAPARYRTAAIAGLPGLWEPEGIQPVKLVPYYQAIMKGDAKAVAAFDDQKGDWWSRRVKSASEDIAAKQTLIEHNPSARCDELLKVYMADSGSSPGKVLALKEIMDCGKLGASKLIPVFVDADDHALDRREILQAWQQADDCEAPLFILSWLRGERDWWNKNYKIADRRLATHGTAYDDPRSVSFRNIDCSIRPLAAFHFVEAATVIEQVRDDWSPAGPYQSGNDPLTTCNDALAELTLRAAKP